MTSNHPLSHIDRNGRANMVDVSEKAITRRVAEASCRVIMSKETVEILADLPKGDAIAPGGPVLTHAITEPNSK